MWPRRAQPDAKREQDKTDVSWDNIAPNVSEADGDRAKETFFFQLASLGFGVSICAFSEARSSREQTPPSRDDLMQAVLVGERVSGTGFVNALGHPTGKMWSYLSCVFSAGQCNKTGVVFDLSTMIVSENGYCVNCTSTNCVSSLSAGIPLYELDIGLAFVVLCLFVGGLVPTRFVYKSINDKPKSILDDIPALVGRISCIGLGSTIAAEAVTGKVRMTVLRNFGYALSLKSSWQNPHKRIPDQVGLTLLFAFGDHLQGILGLLNVQTGIDTISEIEFAAVFVGLFFITNLKSLTRD